MERFKNILSLLYLAGPICGRKKLQKIVYILKNLGADFEENFSLYIYGPFSNDLQLEMDFLVNKEFVKEIPQNGWAYTTYSYELVPEKIEKKDTLETLSKYKTSIEFLNSLSARDLEVLATIFYLKQSDYETDVAIRAKLQSLKPDLSDSFDKGFELYSTINA